MYYDYDNEDTTKLSFIAFLADYKDYEIAYSLNDEDIDEDINESGIFINDYKRKAI